MLVVLDTNDFYTDVHGTRPRLRGILDAPLSQALFEVFVPEVVLQELDKQFAQRSAARPGHQQGPRRQAQRTAGARPQAVRALDGR